MASETMILAGMIAVVVVVALALLIPNFLVTDPTYVGKLGFLRVTDFAAVEVAVVRFVTFLTEAPLGLVLAAAGLDALAVVPVFALFMF